MSYTEFFSQQEEVCSACGEEIPKGAIIFINDDESDVLCSRCGKYI
jgi:hypothetical protein